MLGCQRGSTHYKSAASGIALPYRPFFEHCQPPTTPSRPPHAPHKRPNPSKPAVPGARSSQNSSLHSHVPTRNISAHTPSNGFVPHSFKHQRITETHHILNSVVPPAVVSHLPGVPIQLPFFHWHRSTLATPERPKKRTVIWQRPFQFKSLDKCDSGSRFTRSACPESALKTT